MFNMCWLFRPFDSFAEIKSHTDVAVSDTMENIAVGVIV